MCNREQTPLTKSSREYLGFTSPSVNISIKPWLAKSTFPVVFIPQDPHFAVVATLCVTVLKVQNRMTFL